MEVLEEHRDDDLGFEDGEMLSDANTGSSGEGKKREFIHLLDVICVETLRVEILGIFKFVFV